jgi:hypothetical protein
MSPYGAMVGSVAEEVGSGVAPTNHRDAGMLKGAQPRSCATHCDAYCHTNVPLPNPILFL